MKKNLDNFLLEDWTPTLVEQALMNGDFKQILYETTNDSFEDISNDFLEIQDFDTAMYEIKDEIDGMVTDIN